MPIELKARSEIAYNFDLENVEQFFTFILEDKKNLNFQEKKIKDFFDKNFF